MTAQPLHSQVRETVVGWILEGRLAPGSNLNESRICDDLGVSRTPLRQALFALEQEGLLRLVPNRGFFVAGLSADEVRDLYPVLGRLEAYALELAGPLPTAVRRRLSSLNRSLAETSTAIDAVEINLDWHETLTAHCPNEYLRKLLADTRLRIRRYEYAYFRRGRPEVDASVALHDTLLGLLAETTPDRRAVAAAVETHWLHDLDRIVEFADQHGDGP